MFTDPYKAETSSDYDDEVIKGESQIKYSTVRGTRINLKRA